MRGLQKVESSKDRKAFARDAGMGQVSLLSILAGTLVAFASFAVLLGIVGGILAAVGFDTATLTANDYERLGIGGAVVAALVLFLSYFFGGYIAGRLARRAGALNGGLVLVLAILIGALVAAIVGTQADTEALAADLRVLGVPTSGSDYGTIATVAGILTLLAMAAGAILGGITGERWHAKLAARAWRPDEGSAGRPIQQPVGDDRRDPVGEQGHGERPEETAGRPTQQTEAAEPHRHEPAAATTEQEERWRAEASRAWGTPQVAETAGARAGGAPRTPRRERPLRSPSRG